MISARLDVRIVDKLDMLAEHRRKKRNFLIEQILAEKCGLPFYEWRETDIQDDKE